MAVKKENLEVDAAEARCRPIELITDNGFGLMRVDDRPALAPEGVFVFMVRDPKGPQRKVTVEIDQQAVAEITRKSRGSLSSDSSYWVCFAERHLAEYVWEKDSCPPDGKLRVEQLTLEDTNLAIRWGKS